MKEAGIDTHSYSAHSACGAATSAAKARGLSMAAICKAAGWSGCDTFARFYHRDTEIESMSTTILRSISTHDTDVLDELIQTVAHDHGGYS